MFSKPQVALFTFSLLLGIPALSFPLQSKAGTPSVLVQWQIIHTSITLYFILPITFYYQLEGKDYHSHIPYTRRTHTQWALNKNTLNGYNGKQSEIERDTQDTGIRGGNLSQGNATDQKKPKIKTNRDKTIS